MADKLKPISKAHVVYKTSDGKRVPGATTITGLLNKPYLVKWANNLGLEGIDSSKYTDEAASIGTLAHQMVQDHLQKRPTVMSNYSANQIDLAQNSFLSYLHWEEGHKVEPIICEVPLVSEMRLYGGTVDCYCLLDGVPTIVDFKTGKAIYDEYFVQVAAYKELLIEHGYPVEQIKILRIGRDETEGFEERTVTDARDYMTIFEDLLDIYYLKKRLHWS